MPDSPSGIREISIDKIIPDSDNENKHTDNDIASLAASIADVGLMHAIRVRPIRGTDMYKVVFGEGRLLACRQLGWKTISAQVFIVDDKITALMRFAENFARTKPSLLVECISYANLTRQGYSINEVAASLNLHRRTVYNKTMVGRFPGYILTQLQSEQWGLRNLEEILSLRLNAQGGFDAPEEGWFAKADSINYQEVEQAVDLVNSGKLQTTDAVREYVRRRKQQLKEAELAKVKKAVESIQPADTSPTISIPNQQPRNDIAPTDRDAEHAKDLYDVRAHYERLLQEQQTANAVWTEKTINTLRGRTGEVANLILLLTSENAHLLQDSEREEILVELFLLRQKIDTAIDKIDIGSERRIVLDATHTQNNT